MGILVRLHRPAMAALDRWIKSQGEPRPSRPEAIRRLVEWGLAGAQPAAPSSTKTVAKASEMASREIDHLRDQSVPFAEQEKRKRRLIKGPKEFRDISGRNKDA